MSFYVGIDPGHDGAIVAVDSAGRLRGYFDMPTSKASANQRRRLLVADCWRQLVQLVDTLRELDEDGQVFVCLEDVGSWARGRIAANSLGFASGVWTALCAVAHLPLTRATPREWKESLFGDKSADKAKAQRLASEIFPDLPIDGRPDRADAACLAEHARRQRVGPENTKTPKPRKKKLAKVTKRKVAKK